jgi:RNA polymerase sigma-32 factor
MVKLATTKAQRKLFFNLRSMRESSQTLSPVQVADIARRLSVRTDEVMEMDTRLAGHDMALEGDGDDDDAFAPIVYLADQSNEPTRVLEARARDSLHTEGLQSALAGLDARSRRIVEARWLTEDSPATLHELAAEFGVSAERIRQIEAKAMQKMRLTLAPLVAAG